MGSDKRKSKRIAAKVDAKPKPKQVKVGEARKRKENICSVSTSILNSEENSNISILHYLNKSSLGLSVIPQLRDIRKRCIINQLSRFQVLLSQSVFERRVTSIAWHPVYSQIAAAASKGGELSWYNLNQTGGRNFPGIGPGGSIVAMKFHRDNPYIVYTTAITGEIKQMDLNKQSGKILASTGKFDVWFSSLDVCYDKNLLIAGDTSGSVLLKTVEGNKVWDAKRFHKGKVTHLEFSSSDPNIFVSASIDRNVKIWDCRMIETLKPIRVFPHQKGVNSAYFSHCNRHTLLTTDQHSEIRLYKSPCWDEELIIKHPHRQFQFLTPIKAMWHPMEDIFIVGRYPDDTVQVNDSRTLDFYDGNTGIILNKIVSPTKNISSLNSFNINGDTILSGAGSTVVFLKDKDVCDPFNFQKRAF